MESDTFYGYFMVKLLSFSRKKCFDTRKESLGTQSEYECLQYFLEHFKTF